MKLLHLGCHEVLEYDELKLFLTIPNLEVFSPGAYINNNGLGGRPALPDLDIREEWLGAWAAVPVKPELDPPLSDQKANLTLELLSHFDAVLIQHVPGWLTSNWETLKKWGGRVIWRDIGQTNFEQEAMIGRYAAEGLEIIRYSPKSRMLGNYAGEDAMIRFSKDPEDFLPWVGDRREVMTIGQSMLQREPACGYEIFLASTRPFQRRLYGNNNQASGSIWEGQKSYEQLIEFLSWTRCYFYTGTYPAPYTLNFMEAALAGIPIVALEHGGLPVPFKHYEVPEMLSSWGLGFWAGSTPHELEDRCVRTLSASDDDLRDRSNAQREGAAKLFSFDAVRPLWEELLGC